MKHVCVQTIQSCFIHRYRDGSSSVTSLINILFFLLIFSIHLIASGVLLANFSDNKTLFPVARGYSRRLIQLFKPKTSRMRFVWRTYTKYVNTMRII